MSEVVQIYEGDGKPCYIPGDIEELGKLLRRMSRDVLASVTGATRLYAPPDDQMPTDMDWFQVARMTMPVELRRAAEEITASMWGLESISEDAKSGKMTSGQLTTVSFVVGHMSGNIFKLGGPVDLTLISEIMTLVNRINATCHA